MSDPAHPASPCTGVCAVDPVTQLCAGCSRTMDEIVAWFTAGADEKRAILATVDKRLASGGGAD